MFRVDRALLLSRISETTKDRSVVLAGSPGVGKSWLIAQFIKTCRSASRPNIALSAEDFDVRSIDELTRALGLQTDPITLLRNLGSEAVLIVDGLDALRSDISQRTFRELIGNITAVLPACAVVASIRTFDLQQSAELQRLFFAPIAAGGRQFTEIVVGALSPEELEQVSAQIPDLKSLISRASGEFYELLRNPFNLHLCVLLIQRGVPWRELSVAQSQTQLMGIYWASRIDRPGDGQQRRTLLRGLARRMVDRNALSVSQDVADRASPSSMLGLLQSEEILRLSSTGRVSFAHNILFDYAVARLLLDEESLLPFIIEDPSRSIFFRPSLSFFFHHLWLTDRNLFWKVLFQVLESIQVPERARITAAAALYEAASTIADLDRLLNAAPDVSRTGVTALLRAIQALGGLRSRRRALWVELIERIAENPAIEFVNEHIGLLAEAADATLTGEQELIAATARKLLRWMWDQAATLTPDRAAELADLGSGRVLPVALKFYSSDRQASHRLVLDLLDRIGSPISGPHEPFRLAREIASIVQSDPDLGVEIYQRFFGHHETSESTSAIGGPVFQMRSTRRQDFSLALYALQTAFPDYLKRSPVLAATAAIKSVNVEVPRERKASESDERFYFDLMGREAVFIADHSEIWDRGGRDYLSLGLLDSALNCATELLAARTTAQTGMAIIEAVTLEGRYAVCWRRLLEAVRRNPSALYPVTIQLLSVPKLLAAPETTVEAGEVLKATYSAGLVDDASGANIEAAISAIPDTDIIVRYEKPISIRNRLLMCIPAEHLRSATLTELSKLLAETRAAHENKPYHQITFGALSAEEALRFQGVETEDPENAELLELIGPLETFERKYLNETPDLKECMGVSPHLLKTRDRLPSFAGQEELAVRARGAMCATAEAIMKNSSLPKEDPLWQVCRTILLEGAQDSAPEFDPKYHLTFDRPSWGGPSPRIEAGQGLGHLVWNWGVDSEALQALARLSSDPVPAVRFQVPNALLGLYKHDAKQEFWTLLSAMVESEATTGVMIAVVTSLGRVAGGDATHARESLSRVIERGFALLDQHELIDHIVGILVWLYIWRPESAADEQLIRFENDAAVYHRVLAQEVFAATAYFRMGNAEERSGFHKAKALTERIVRSVYHAENVLFNGPVTDASRDALGNLLVVIDQAVLRIAQLLKGAATPTDHSDSTGRELYFEVKDLLHLLATPPSGPGGQYLLAPTAHHLIEAFNCVLDYDPHGVLENAAAVCKAASDRGYQFDQLAIAETIKLAERVLADHRDALQVKDTATAFGEILDSFVKAGWPEAVRLVFRVNEAVR
jgi:hypothetical protein